MAYFSRYVNPSCHSFPMCVLGIDPDLDRTYIIFAKKHRLRSGERGG